MNDAFAASFTGLVDLAAQSLGGQTLGASDEFFAAMDNLLKPGRAEFIAGKYTERGKWMDGWESRRRRGPGQDYCVIALGVPGYCAGFDIDTQHFVGNHPPFASVEGVLAPAGSSLDALLALPWLELLPQSALRPGAQNLFAAAAVTTAVSHLRLSIFPDGGVARFRAFGRVEPQWSAADQDDATRQQAAPELVDLVALRNGGRPLACSDAFFGPMHNLLLPGRAADMGGGWETRRKRMPGHDWIVLELGAAGRPHLVEVDTNHFKGNYPDRCSLDGIYAPKARITDLIASSAWASLLPEVKLEAHQRHFFAPPQLPGVPVPITHVRLNIVPDGGVSRLRLWGQREV